MHLYCGNCGMKLSEDAVFYQNCGTRVAVGAQNSRQGASQPQTQDTQKEKPYAQTMQQEREQGDAQPAGEGAVSRNTSHAKWGSKKDSKGYYNVTLNCVVKEEVTAALPPVGISSFETFKKRKSLSHYPYWIRLRL